MTEKWKEMNKLLNTYGGFISLASLFLSVFIYIKTGQIKNNIKKLLNYENYIKKKKVTREKIIGILDSIEKDKIYDSKIIGELNREVASIDHYSAYFDIKTRKNMKNLRKTLNKGFEVIKRDKLIREINKVIGDLEIDETYLG